MDQKQFELICKKLDKITAVLASQAIQDKNDKIYALKKLGLSSDEVGPLVGVQNPRQMKGWKRK
jgi:hypothetical protein